MNTGEHRMVMEIFNKYKILYTIETKITNEIPLRIGGDKDNPRISEPNLPVIKDKNGTPIIPGSSLKGYYRGNIHRLLMTIWNNEIAINNLMDKLFGGSGTDDDAHSSPILFSTLVPKDINKRLTDSRTHIQIDRRSQGVKNTFEVEYVYENTDFIGKISAINVHPVFFGLFHTIKTLAETGIARLGGFKSRGYGRIKIDYYRMHIDLIGVNSESKTYKALIPDKGDIQFVISDKVTMLVFKDFKIPINGTIQYNPTIFGKRITIEESNLSEFLSNLSSILESVIK